MPIAWRSARRPKSMIGPLRQRTLTTRTAIADPVVRARAAHVVSENQRVREFAAALAAGDLAGSRAI